MTTETETISQFEVVLMHEIGHAWMAQKLGIEPMFVEMDEDEDEGLGGWTHFGKALQGVTWKQTMLIAMAGMAGEAVVTGEDEYRPHPGALQNIAVATQALQRRHSKRGSLKSGLISRVPSASLRTCTLCPRATFFSLFVVSKIGQWAWQKPHRLHLETSS